MSSRQAHRVSMVKQNHVGGVMPATNQQPSACGKEKGNSRRPSPKKEDGGPGPETPGRQRHWASAPRSARALLG